MSGDTPAVAWVIANGTAERFHGWHEYGFGWFDRKDEAIWYARREDAEKIAAENEDAWLILPIRGTAPETAAERDRLRADLATCGKDWADERQAAQAEAAALRAEVERLQVELRVAYKLPLAMGHPIAVELESLRAEKAELVAALKAFLSYLEGQCDCEESSGCRAAKLRSQARAALAKATATEGGE